MDIQGKNLEGEAGKDHGRAVSGSFMDPHPDPACDCADCWDEADRAFERSQDR